jgi:hypothetical protein
MIKVPTVRESVTSAGQVGDVVDSILDEATIQLLRGPGWVLMDGRNIEGTRLNELTGLTTLPDARGVFRRAKNNGRSDGNENPAGELAVGSNQSDSTATNGLAATTSGSTHTHGIQTSNSDGNIGNTQVRLTTFTDSGDGLTGLTRTLNGNQTNFSPLFINNQNSSHAHVVTGDAETRPTNITVNTYIRID